jgi:Tfp pilus assembly protein, tip-associated adhesin PilY1
MLVVDNSGSMLRFAYFDGWDTDTESDDVWGTSPSAPCTEFNPAFTYYGYFNPDYWYQYSSSRFYPTNLKTSAKTANDWDGNFLNWLSMRRIDVIRKVITGGKVVASGGENRLIGEAPDGSGRGRYKRINNAENYTSLSGTKDFNVYASGITAQITVSGNSYHIKVAVGTTPTGILQAVGTNARWGLTYYNGGDYQGGYVQYSVTDRNMSTLTGSVLNSINNKRPNSNTPLAETLWTVTGYFAQQTSMSISSLGPRYHSGDYTVNNLNDPYNYGTGVQPIWAWCAKSFVLLITDGEPCADGYMSDDLKNYATGRSAYDCTAAGDVGDLCYVYPCSAGNYDPGIEDVALYAHTNDIRSDLEDKQTLDLYTVFAFGAGSELLKYAAINGGFTDKNSNNQPDLQAEWDEDGDGEPDNYYTANDGYLLEEKLLAAINQILKKTASGTSVAVLATSATGEGSLFQAFFEPKVVEGVRTVRWVGHLQGLWVDTKGNLREDTNNDSGLVYTQDKIIKYILDPDTNAPEIEKYSDSNGDGVADSTTPDETVSLDAATPIWEAGKLLAKKTASSRTIYTFKDSNNNGLSDTGEFIPFTESNWGGLQPFLRASTEAEARNIIKFSRGEQVTGYRERRLTVDGLADQVWKLGDIVYSTPTVSSKPAGNYQITYGDTSYSAYYSAYKDRDVIICTGANDGMLHAFWTGRYHSGDNPATGNESTPQVEMGWYEDTSSTLNLGDEIWAYVPCNVLPHLKWLTDPTYGDNTHVYYVDLKPRIADVKIFTPDSTHINGWGTVLIGGMRLGGGPLTINNFGGGSTSRTFRSAYFALDITDPANPDLLWEYTDADLGYTSSYPTIAKVGAKWFAVFGSGPTNLARGDCDNTGKNGKIFIVDIADRNCVPGIYGS